MHLSLWTMYEEGKQPTENECAVNKKVKVGAVSYLNTKPLIYGFEKGMMKDAIELLIDHPGNIANALLDGKIDIGLVPVAIIPQLKSHFIIADYCISADGEVASVCLFSEVPLNQIKTVLLDYQSRTSVMLVQYLFKHYWKLNPTFIAADNNFISQINGTTAAVIIGDRAFEMRKTATYCYDLSLAWKNCTGLPFVFAAWVSRRAFSKQFMDDFNKANHYGLMHIDEVVNENPYNAFDLNQYYTKYISYSFDEAKKAGLQLFLDWCAIHKLELDNVFAVDSNQ